MKIKEIKHNLALAIRDENPRSKGLHMSDIYGPYYAALDKRFRQEGPPPAEKMELGFCWEDIFEPVLAKSLFGKRPKEQQCYVEDEGNTITIFFSPDYVFFVDGETVLGEFKFTWYSCKGAPRGRKFAKWISQMKLYCYHLNINKARLYVFFVNGTYKPPSPKIMAWEFEFTDTELEEEWQIMLRFARQEGLLRDKTKDKHSNVDAGRRVAAHPKRATAHVKEIQHARRPGRGSAKRR